MKPKEQTKSIEDKSNNQPNATAIFNELINKSKALMSKLYDSVDYNNLKFEYAGKTKDVSFYEYMNSKELFNGIKNNQIKFSELENKKDNCLKKLNDVKAGRKNTEQKEVINSIENFNISREEVITFLETTLKCYLMQITMRNKTKLREKALKY